MDDPFPRAEAAGRHPRPARRIGTISRPRTSTPRRAPGMDSGKLCVEPNRQPTPGVFRHRRTLRVVVGCTVLLLAVVAGLFVWTWRTNPPPRVVRAELRPTGPVRIGDPLSFSVEVECPWSRLPLLPMKLTLPAGIQELPAQRRRLSGLGAGVWRWTSRVRLQAYALGATSGGKVRIHLTADRTGAQGAVDVLLPKIVVRPRLTEPTEKLTLAPRIPASAVASRRSWWQWAVLALVILAAGATAVWLFRRRGTDAPLERNRPPWEAAGAALQELEEALPLPAEEFFVRLTDIVRHYIEARFRLRAREQTTPEFLASLRRDSVLDDAQRAMLADFLTAADMVKFARRDATQEQLRDALGQATRFVAETRPRLEPREGSPAPEGGSAP